MFPNIRLVQNRDGSYDLLLDYRDGAEFAEEPGAASSAKRLAATLRGYAKNVKIKSVKILVSGVLVATFAFSSFLTALAAGDRYSMGYLYTGTDLQQIEYVNQTGDALDVVSPSYFDLREDGSLKLNYLSPFFIKTMHEKGIKVVPFLSNHWNRTAGINALQDVESLSTQIAEYVEEYDLDGVNVDIENVTHLQRDQYTELVRLLREKIPQHKEISVAVAANPNNWQTGWHGSYDYAALAQYADHLLLMAYDEHFEGGEAGPVASIGFVEDSIRYALERVPADKIVVGIPFFGRVWSLDNDRIVGKGTSSKTIQRILESCEATVTYDEATQSVRAEFMVTEESGEFVVGGDFVLSPGRYVVWYENDESYREKLSLIEKYDLKGAGVWALGQEDPSVWENYEDWINGEDAEEETPSLPSEPESPEEDMTTPPAAEDEETTVPPTSEEEEETNTPPASGSDEETTVPPTVEDDEETTTPPAPGGGETVTPPTTDSTPPVIPPTGETTPPTAPPDAEESTPSADATFVVHEVRAGDSLWKIAQQYLGNGTRYREIMVLNNLTSDVIYPGMQLRLPIELRVHTVQRGDSLWKIAQQYLGSGTRYRELMAFNNLTSDVIHPGMQLEIWFELQPYTVQRGDSLWEIASEQLGSGTRYREIMSLNGLKNDQIQPGQTLFLPTV